VETLIKLQANNYLDIMSEMKERALLKWKGEVGNGFPNWVESVY